MGILIWRDSPNYMGIMIIDNSFDSFSLISNPIVLSPLAKEALVGSLLGDGWLEKQKVNARFRFEQSDSRKEFFFHLYEIFSPYCQSSPKLRKRQDKRTNKVYLTWHFSTKSYPMFTDIHNLFYIDKKKSSTC